MHSVARHNVADQLLYSCSIIVFMICIQHTISRLKTTTLYQFKPLLTKHVIPSAANAIYGYVAETSCDDGLVHKSTCYKIHRERVDWFTAVNKCLSYNASLAVFDDDILTYFTVQTGPFWIGLIRSWWTWPGAGQYPLNHCRKEMFQLYWHLQFVRWFVKPSSYPASFVIRLIATGWVYNLCTTRNSPIANRWRSASHYSPSGRMQQQK